MCACARAGERERTAVAGPWEVWGEPQCGATALLLLPLAASSSTSPQVVTSSVCTRTRRGATSRHARGDDDHDDRDQDHDYNFDCDRRDRSEPERREMHRSYERRRWLRDGGGGGAGCSRRAACCCGGSVVHFSFSSSPAPALAKSSRPPLSPSLQRPGQAGDEKARPPVTTGAVPRAVGPDVGAMHDDPEHRITLAWARTAPRPSSLGRAVAFRTILLTSFLHQCHIHRRATPPSGFWYTAGGGRSGEVR